ncbi:hypothetical protein KEM56_003103 [Ascosphaera pollenicola]|nr:hypothetical protein KEM56_003103 [Ascosphaera pollenicola]
MDTLDTFAGKDRILDKILEQHIVRQLELTETFQKESNEVLTPEEQKAVEDEYADEQLKRNDYAAWLRKNTVVPARPPQPSTPITSAHPPASAPALAGPQAASTMGTVPQMAPPQWAVAGPPALQPDMSASLPTLPPTLNGPLYTPLRTISATGPPILSLQAHTHPIAPPPGLVPQPSPNDNDVQMGNT